MKCVKIWTKSWMQIPCCFTRIWILGGKFGSNPHILLAPTYFTSSNGCVTLWRGLHAFDLFRRFALTSSLPPPPPTPPEHKTLLSQVDSVPKKVPCSSATPTWHENRPKREIEQNELRFSISRTDLNLHLFIYIFCRRYCFCKFICILS